RAWHQTSTRSPSWFDRLTIRSSGLAPSPQRWQIPAMHIILTLLLALLATPVFAQGWDHYDNPRFAYGIDIPPGFTTHDLSDNDDGQGFQKLDQAVGLVVWGGYLPGNFEREVSAAMAEAEADAWNITRQTTTPRWAEFSAIKGIRILHQRVVLLCDG